MGFECNTYHAKSMYGQEHRHHEFQAYLNQEVEMAKHTDAKSFKEKGVELNGIKKLQTTKGKKCALTPAMKKALRQMWVGGFQTPAKQAEWDGAEALCSECQVSDNIHHRLWVCPKGRKVREEEFEKKHIEGMVALGPRSFAATRAWVNTILGVCLQADPQWR